MRIGLYPNFNLQNNQQQKTMKTSKPVTFGSYEHEEYMLELISQLAKNFEKKAPKKEMDFYDIRSTEETRTLLGSVADLTFNSEHENPIAEIFGSENEAKTARENLTTACQKTSRNLREAFQSTSLTKDPIITLIAAGQIKDLIPDKSKVPSNMSDTIVKKSKEAVLVIVKNSDKSNLDKEDHRLITELTGIIENSQGADFGEDYRNLLKKLVDKKNKERKPEYKKTEPTTTTNKQYLINYKFQQGLQSK